MRKWFSVIIRSLRHDFIINIIEFKIFMYFLIKRSLQRGTKRRRYDYSLSTVSDSGDLGRT